MIEIRETSTVGEVFFEAALRYGDQLFLAAPANPARASAPQGLEWTYAQTATMVRSLMERYASAGYGVGHRVGMLLENRLEHFLHKLAMNALGVCCVPLNPDHRPQEMAYVVGHAQLDLVVVLDHLLPLLQQALSLGSQRPAVVTLQEADLPLPRARQPATSTVVEAASVASVLYTSGTTGRPKGCLLSHRYELAAGRWYATRGGLIAFGEACERIYNPLPVFHVNASVFSFYCALLKGNCQVQTDRFQPSRWFNEVHESQATVVHYLGVVVPMLLNQPSHALERNHRVRFAIGAGVDPQRHAAFEQRFGYPLIEIWGMTEYVRAIFDAEEPRQVGTRAIGRAQPGLEVRVASDAGDDLPDGTPGELLVRHSAATPRKDAFSGYLHDDAATEEAWRGGWFHTGDIVVRDPDGLLHFLERRKNIIRRSGENIAAAEVEAALQAHPAVAQAAVLAVKDEVREEEVLACVVLKPGYAARPDPNDPLVQGLFEHCNSLLSYFKTPGWLFFSQEIPTTSTQKVQKHQLFADVVDPRTAPGVIDLRHLKKRDKPPGT
ncbi:long-chain fatty acid--CoA ligase [Hydrogenophaga sp. Root209]|uniref:AMP-binding protein n=1 Tax=Hydrogenophaga sp. Root209 TaxID=1736490 RepID=UPI0006FC070F|nr:AMP-binding protein [Hydrogenophaga sp. Root209]KRC06280.1 long-chain fatty acid--CoA ligase [Hydrogenophaga sp. Root209]